MVGKPRKQKQFVNKDVKQKSKISLDEIGDGAVDQVTACNIKIEPPEFVTVNETGDVLETTQSVDANVFVKEEPIDSLQPFAFINEECFDEHTETNDHDEPGAKTCGRIIMQVIGDGVAIYRLKCNYCKSIFSTTVENFWPQFVSHMTENHAATQRQQPKENKNQNLPIASPNVDISKEAGGSLFPNKEKIEKPLKPVENEDEVRACENNKAVLNESTCDTDDSKAEDIDEENVNNNESDSDENGENSEDETYEPKTKRPRKSMQSNTEFKKGKERIISFDHPNKACVIAFLELLKTHSILWHPRQYIMKRFDEALAAVNINFNERFPNYAMEKDQVRQSINKIKDLYSRGSNETLKRRVKSHLLKTKHPEYFDLCSVIEENSKNIKQQCDLCEAIFYSPVDLQIHKVKKHAIGELPFKCQRCGYGFACPEKLASHEEKHNRVKSFRCELCNQSFYFENKLQAHMVLHTDDSKLICEICGKKFPTQSKYRRHKLHHEAPKEKCEICGKLYFEKWTLSEHLKSHRNERRYKCDICGKSFNRQEGVTIHKRGVHKIKLQTKKYVWVNRVAKSSNSEADSQMYDVEERGDAHNSNSNSSSYSSAPNEQNNVDVKPQISNNLNHQIFPLEILNSLMN